MMSFSRRQVTRFAAAAAALCIIVLSGLEESSAQSANTLKIIAPLPPGSAVDILSRVLADQISRTQGVTIVVENRPGAASAIGTEAVARATPDGRTLLINTNQFIINALVQNVNYHPVTSFEPICELVRSPTLIVVRSDSPYRTLADLVGAARSRPGELTMASIGPAGLTQVAFELLKRETKIDMTFVPFPGIPPALNALLGGHVTAVFAVYGGETAAQIRGGNVRPLAAASLTRIEALPETPTVAESGYRDYNVELWGGMFAPAKTPGARIAQLASWFTSAMEAPEVREKLIVQGFYPAVSCGDQFSALIRKQYQDYEQIIREAHIKAE